MYIYLLNDFKSFNYIKDLIESDPRFCFHSENLRQSLYSTEKNGLYLTLDFSPYSNKEIAVRFMYGEPND